ncbi:hypothetical protein, partial [Deinococcus marmoris]|uniref:hypothetical protein n=1 Tax=Deinococcus marmoris TaxID=249408 RepID=UPI0039EECCA3
MEKPLPQVNIEANIEAFFENPSGNYCLPDKRNASFDYCYNYFQGFRKDNKISEIASDENLEMSCLQIGFYLASWGMLRGSAFLSQKSVAHYSKLIKYISEFQEDFWAIDVADYNKTGVAEKILKCEKQIREIVSEGTGKKRIASETLTTKIMLGVFGNIPAFDSYFLKGFENIYISEAALKKIYNFYSENINILDRYEIPTIRGEFKLLAHHSDGPSVPLGACDTPTLFGVCCSAGAGRLSL